MDLFKERLKITLYCLRGLIFAIVLFGLILLISLSEFSVLFLTRALISIVGSILIFLIIYGIYWLFIDPFRKTKENEND